jgi:poly(3-hydroxybutyrate) depolymerase
MFRRSFEMTATRLLALSCAVWLGACDSDSSGSGTDGETDSGTGDASTGGDSPTTANPTDDSNGVTSGDSNDPSSTDSDDPSDGSTSDDPTDPTDDPTDDSTDDTGVDPGGPQIPKLQGDCPEFPAAPLGSPAQLTFPVGSGTRDGLVWHDPTKGGGGPLVFYFHGGGGDPAGAEATVTSDAIEDILNRGGMVIAPISDPAAETAWFLTTGSAQNDVVMQDSMVACAYEVANIDPYHIHGVGFSAGGIHVGISSLLRASYMASTITYSGGVYNGVTPDTSDAAPSTLAFHGGPSDEVGGLPFDQATALYASQVRDRGGYAIECNHGTGHGYPDNVAGVFRRADTYNFLMDHPWGVDPHPYPGDGIPDWVPPYCSAE